MPFVTWFSSGDQTNADLGVTCKKIEGPLPGITNVNLARFGKTLIQLVEEL